MSDASKIQKIQEEIAVKAMLGEDTNTLEKELKKLQK
jgi:hypothetical protein